MTDPAVQRRTRQRAAVEDYLAGCDGFATAQQIHDGLKSLGGSVGLATVYRTLQSLSESHDVDSIRTPEGEAAYRRCESHAHHHHLICQRCGHTEELVASVVEAWAAQMAAERGFTQVSHDVELFGLCAECSAAE